MRWRLLEGFGKQRTNGCKRRRSGGELELGSGWPAIIATIAIATISQSKHLVLCTMARHPPFS
jgi:hypothetical protein